MPDSETSRIVAVVPRRSGSKCLSLMSSVSSAWPFGVSSMFDTVPIAEPDTWTRSPLTIWLAFWNTALIV